MKAPAKIVAVSRIEVNVISKPLCLFSSEPDLRARCEDKCMGRANSKMLLFFSAQYHPAAKFAGHYDRVLGKFAK
jgi:hypothetical protein